MFHRLFPAVAVAVALVLPAVAIAADWTSYSVPEVGLTFDLPGAAVRDVSEPDDGDAAGDITHILRSDDATYVVQVSQANMDLGDPAAGAEIGVQVMKKNLPGVTIVSDDVSRQGRVFVRRTVARQPGGGMAAQMTLLDKRVLVAVVYFQTSGTTLSPDAERFLASVKMAPR